MKPICFLHSHTLIQWLAVCTLKAGLQSRVEEGEEEEYGTSLYAFFHFVLHPLVSINYHTIKTSDQPLKTFFRCVMQHSLHQGCIMLLCGSVETFKFQLA